MSFDFGGPKFRAFDIIGLLQGVEFVVRYGWLAYKHRYEIFAFLKRNHRVMSAIFVTSFAGMLAVIFSVGYFEILLGFVKMHLAMSGIVTIGAVGFGVFTYEGYNETRREWQRRPEPTPVGSD
jgi:hypothetical protein